MKEPTEPLEVIYRLWKEHGTFEYKGQRYHIGWPLLLIGFLALCGYLGTTVPYDYR